MTLRRALLVALVAGVSAAVAIGAVGLAGGLDIGSGGGPGAGPATTPTETVTVTETATEEPDDAGGQERPERRPVVVIDPGHQLGNHNFPGRIRQPVEAGGATKPCNTTGTSTDGGFPEATFVWVVARRVARTLEDRGMRVVLTRNRNSERRWGPCVDERGRAGNPGEPGPTADAKVSIHADGSLAPGARGFHVIAPGDLPGWTDDIAADSRDLARVLRDRLGRAGFPRSTYAGEEGLDVRTDLATLNLSDVPTALVELGNMRDRREARVMQSPRGQRRYARAIARAVLSYLG